MEIIVGKTAGFCYGVKRAVDGSIKQLEENKDKKTYCLGELVHNKQVTEELISEGVNFIDDIEEAKGKVVIRSHGVEKEVYEKAQKLGIDVVDLTCPKVLHTHKIAEEYSNEEYFIFLTGKAEHPEIIGTVSFCGKQYFIIEKEEQVPEAIAEFEKSNLKKALIMSQTTFSMEKFKKITEEIKTKIGDEKLEIKNTICSATKQRQEETENIAKQVDVMIIIGGKHSSNSNKLYEISKKYCKKVIFIETAEELDTEQIDKMSIIGIMAGASTPKKSIEKTIEKLKKI